MRKRLILSNKRTLLLVYLILLSLLLSSDVISANVAPTFAKRPSLAKEPDLASKAPFSVSVAPDNIADAKVNVLVFLREQPLHEIAEQVKAEYEPDILKGLAHIRVQG
jgi:hypothetical protein